MKSFRTEASESDHLNSKWISLIIYSCFRLKLQQIVDEEDIKFNSEVVYPKKTASDFSRAPPEDQEWKTNSKRVGLLARKLGMTPQW